MPRGGKRAPGPGKRIGRPKNTTEDGGMGKGFASQVLNRIKELKLEGIRSAEEYALDILKARDGEAHSFFKLLLAYKHGKPVQPVMSGDTREDTRELDFGNLPMPAAPKPGAAGKPN
jgi:hypothetical protein